MPDNIQMHVKRHYFDLLEAGSKSVEFRLNDEKRKSIKVGEKICFVCNDDQSRFVVKSVSDIIRSPEFSTLIKNINPDLLGGISPQTQLMELGNL